MKKSRYLIIALLCAVAQGAWADDVKYIERSWTGGNTTGHVVETEKTCTSYTIFTSDLNSNGSELSGGWYVFRGTASKSYYGRVNITGNVSIILEDGCDHTFTQGFHIADGCTLTIYGQSGDTSKLTCNGGGSYNAGIGGNGGSSGAGIGSGQDNDVTPKVYLTLGTVPFVR